MALSLLAGGDALLCTVFVALQDIHEDMGAAPRGPHTCSPEGSGRESGNDASLAPRATKGTKPSRENTESATVF